MIPCVSHRLCHFASQYMVLSSAKIDWKYYVIGIYCIHGRSVACTGFNDDGMICNKDAFTEEKTHEETRLPVCRLFALNQYSRHTNFVCLKHSAYVWISETHMIASELRKGCQMPIVRHPGRFYLTIQRWLILNMSDGAQHTPKDYTWLVLRWVGTLISAVEHRH